MNKTLVAVAVLLASCEFDVPNLNQPSIDSLQNPTPSQVNALATGLLIGSRKAWTERVGAVVEWGILGREALVLTQSEPRFINQLLAGPLSSGDANFGGNFWVIPYANIRNANLLLHTLDNPALTGMTDAEKEALRGFAKTMQAYEFMQVVDSHYTNGAVLDVDHPLGSPPGPIVTDLNAIYTSLEALLDDAETHLTAGGTAFSFPLGTGFIAFDTPSTFTRFNRALRARVAVYHGKYADALTALAASFLDTNADLNLGAYHAYGAGSGDTPNDLNDTSIFCDDSVVKDAEQLRNTPGGIGCNAGSPPFPLACLDQRVQSKVKLLSAPSTLSGHSASYGFALYPDSTSHIGIIRNEELILLRAEANIGLGNVNTAPNGAASARDDINLIRRAAGLNSKAPFADAATALDDLLTQKRYSLLFEGGHRWIDLRRYGKLDSSHMTVVAGDVIHDAFPIPLTETQGH